MRKKAITKLTRYDWHEALDRTHLCAETFDSFVANHAVIHHHFKPLADQIGALLGQLYQAIGSNDPYWANGGTDKFKYTRDDAEANPK